MITGGRPDFRLPIVLSLAPLAHPPCIFRKDGADPGSGRIRSRPRRSPVYGMLLQRVAALVKLRRSASRCAQSPQWAERFRTAGHEACGVRSGQSQLFTAAILRCLHGGFEARSACSASSGDINPRRFVKLTARRASAAFKQDRSAGLGRIQGHVLEQAGPIGPLKLGGKRRFTSGPRHLPEQGSGIARSSPRLAQISQGQPTESSGRRPEP